MDIRAFLLSAAEAAGVPLTPAQAEQFNTYAALLVQWNEKMNLTAITEPEEIAEKHFVDSLLLTLVYDLPAQAKVADVGTGAGFPGIPLLLARPDVQLTLLDSQRKRLQFLQAVLDELGLRAQTLHARAEDAGRLPACREQFDAVTARAVAPMPALCEYCLPLVRPGGVFLAMKGPNLPEELDEARKALALLGGEVERVAAFTLPQAGRRLVVVVRKTRATPQTYPRAPGKIKQSPL